MLDTMDERMNATALSRRAFLGVGVAGAAVGTAVQNLWAQDLNLRRRALTRTLRPATRKQPIDPTLLALVNRVTMGFNQATYDEAESLGYMAFLEQQLDPDSIDDTDWETRLAALGYDTLTMTSQQIYNTYAEMQGVPVQHLVRASLLRGVYSKKQLLERMVEFWTDHFNINIQDGQCRRLKTADDRDVIRQHALGNFPDLLEASATSGCMLFYLDNYTNIVGLAQENYARELMELHTLGVGGGYTQADVEEVARCLTGWTFWGVASGIFGDFRYRDNLHDQGEKTVLGNVIAPNGGVNDGYDVIDILAYHPSTARFISHKLCERFLGYDPPEDIVESTKATYLATGGDIKEMLRVILHPTSLTYLATPKFKRPVHLMTSLLRATQANVLQPRYIDDQVGLMGQRPFHWDPPDGYPDSLETWSASLLIRWQFASSVLASTQSVGIDVVGLLASQGGNVPGQQAQAINQILTGGTMSNEEVNLLQSFFDEWSSLDGVNREGLALAAAMPGFQWY